MEIRKLDRRQENIYVKNDRRSTIDRRSNPRTESIFCALESIPTVRRVYNIPDKIKKSDYFPAIGAIGLTLVNIKEDIRDVKSAIKQIYSKINKNYHYDPLYDRKNYQHSFSFTRGVIGEKWLHDKIAEGNPFAQKIHEMDKTIDKTKLGEWINEKFKIITEDSIKIVKIKNVNEKCARAYKFKSSVLGGKTIARAMKRTTIAGIAVMTAFEVPTIIKECLNSNSFSEKIKKCARQLIKSTANIILTTVGIGIGGAIGAKYIGATGSLIGMGIGAIASNKTINKIESL